MKIENNIYNGFTLSEFNFMQSLDSFFSEKGKRLKNKINIPKDMISFYNNLLIWGIVREGKLGEYLYIEKGKNFDSFFTLQCIFSFSR